MSAPAKTPPDGFHSVTPYLAVRGAAAAIDFYREAFGAVERCRLKGPQSDTIGHAEISIGDSIVMLSDEFPEYGRCSPSSFKGTPVSLLIYVEDVDAVFSRALAAGAKERQPVTDKFYGDRSGCLTDPYGHEWTIATHQEDVSLEEMNRRMEQFYADMAKEKTSG